jgi:hypothetical protein
MPSELIQVVRSRKEQERGQIASLLIASMGEISWTVVEGELRKVETSNGSNVRIHIGVGVVETTT